jgi:hypothetical protein
MVVVVLGWVGVVLGVHVCWRVGWSMELHAFDWLGDVRR